MTRRGSYLAALITLITVLCVGCTPSDFKERYDVCLTGDMCADEWTCLTSNTSINGQKALKFCTKTCKVTSDCLPSASGVGATCVTQGASGQCFRQCDKSGACPTNEVCTTAKAGTPKICVPGTGMSQAKCGDASQPCCNGAECAEGLTCGKPVNGKGTICGVSAQYTGCLLSATQCVQGTECINATATTGGFCSTECTSPLYQCPDGIWGHQARCYNFSNRFQCYQECAKNEPCAPGTVCRKVTPDGLTGFIFVCAP